MQQQNFFLEGGSNAGVLIYSPSTPPKGQLEEKESPIIGVKDPCARWSKATSIELVVDDQIVELDRIKIPEGVEVIDKRKDESSDTDSQSAS